MMEYAKQQQQQALLASGGILEDGSSSVGNTESKSANIDAPPPGGIDLGALLSSGAYHPMMQLPGLSLDPNMMQHLQGAFVTFPVPHE